MEAAAATGGGQVDVGGRGTQMDVIWGKKSVYKTLLSKINPQNLKMGGVVENTKIRKYLKKYLKLRLRLPKLFMVLASQGLLIFNCPEQL